MDEVALAERPAAVLILIAVVAIAVLLFLIIKVRLHAFFSLIVVSVLTGLAAGISMGDVVSVVIDGFSTTVGTVALLVGFGAVLGRLVEMTGGAQVLADRMLARFGEQRAPLALAVASLFYAFPIFLDAGFIVMLPIIYTVARRLGGSFMLYVLPSIGAFLMMHALTPPHPGPTAAATVMGGRRRNGGHHRAPRRAAHVVSRRLPAQPDHRQALSEHAGAHAARGGAEELPPRGRTARLLDRHLRPAAALGADLLQHGVLDPRSRRRGDRRQHRIPTVPPDRDNLDGPADQHPAGHGVAVRHAAPGPRTGRGACWSA